MVMVVDDDKMIIIDEMSSILEETALRERQKMEAIMKELEPNERWIRKMMQELRDKDRMLLEEIALKERQSIEPASTSLFESYYGGGIIDD